MSKWKLKDKQSDLVLVGAKVKPEIKKTLEKVSEETGHSISFIAAQCIEHSLKELEI